MPPNYTDDTSGNRSKKWNKFDLWCFLLAGMNRHDNAKVHRIHFVTCSNQAGATEIMAILTGSFTHVNNYT